MGPGARAKPRIFAHNGAVGGQAACGIETLFGLSDLIARAQVAYRDNEKLRARMIN